VDYYKAFEIARTLQDLPAYNSVQTEDIIAIKNAVTHDQGIASWLT
jgi:hypothetical protein